jgi:RNA recognition motif-containing protein
MKGATIFCGNLSYDLTDTELRAAFEVYGKVVDARIIVDQWTEQSRGFGFVDMASEDDAARAMTALEARLLRGRRLRCSPGSSDRQVRRSWGGGMERGR